LKKSVLIFSIIINFIQIRAQQLEWAVQYGIFGPTDKVKVVLDADGNVYTAGNFNKTADFDPGPGVYNLTPTDFDSYILKLDTAGRFIWAKQIAGTSAEQIIRNITLDNLGNIYLFGLINGPADFDPGPGTNILTPSSYYATFILKLDTAGNFIWVKKIEADNYYNANDIETDIAGNIYLTGAAPESDVDLDPGLDSFFLDSNSSSYILKLNSSGNFIWALSFSSSTDAYATIKAITIKDGNIYATGQYNDTVDFDPGPGIFNMNSSYPTTEDVFITKFDTAGNFIWAKNFGGTRAENANDIAVDANDNIYITGRFEGTADFDPDPAVSYNLTSGGAQIFDLFVLKLDASGNFLWAKDTNKSGQGNAIALDTANNVYVTGKFVSTTDFDPGAGIYNLPIGNGFILKLNEAGNFCWAVKAGNDSSGTLTDAGLSIAVDKKGNIYTRGIFSGRADFNPDTSITYNLYSYDPNRLPPGPTESSFIWKLSPVTCNLTGNVVTTKVNCTTANSGTATISATGANPPFSYQWSNGATTNTATGLTVGSYTATITGIVGCNYISPPINITKLRCYTSGPSPINVPYIQMPGAIIPR